MIPAMSPQHEKTYDIAFVGSGIACTMTLIALSNLLLEAEPRRSPLRVAVIEKEDEFWKGIAYGVRSSINSLVITSLKEFVYESEKTGFIEWVETNQEKWLEHFRLNAGEAGSNWIKRNAELIRDRKWDGMFLPRRLYGLYNSEKLASALSLLREKELAEVTQVRAEAIDLVPEENGNYAVILESSDGKQRQLLASRVVLAIGSPPISSIQSKELGERCPHTYINDIYTPTVDSNFELLKSSLAAIPDKSKRNVLILGSNASSLETLYLINHDSEIRSLANAIVVLSRSGLLPYKICDSIPAFKFHELERFEGSESLTAVQLITAIKADVQRAEETGVNIADLFHPISDVVVRLFKRLNPSELEIFFCQHGMTFTKLMRRAGGEYRDAAAELMDAGLLDMVKGEFLELGESPTTSGCVAAFYFDPTTKSRTTHPLPFSTIVNCGGFEELGASSSRILANVISRRLCEINATSRGLLVNEKMEANRNLYVMGPLLGGNSRRF